MASSHIWQRAIQAYVDALEANDLEMMRVHRGTMMLMFNADEDTVNQRIKANTVQEAASPTRLHRKDR